MAFHTVLVFWHCTINIAEYLLYNIHHFTSQTAEECSYIETGEFSSELCRAIPIIIDGVKDGKTITEIESQMYPSEDTKAWNLSVMYETAMLTLSEAIFHLKGVKNDGKDEIVFIDSSYSTERQGLYALVKAIEKTSIECEEVFAIIKSQNVLEEELPDIDWITGDQTTIPETYNACEIGDAGMDYDIESLKGSDKYRTERISPASASSFLGEVQVKMNIPCTYTYG